MDDFLRKLFWSLLGLGAGIFMVGFGVCAAFGFVFSLNGMASTDGFLILGLTMLGAAMAWGFAKLALYSNRQRQASAPDDSARKELP